MGILWDKQRRDCGLSSYGNNGILGSQFDPEKSYLHQMFLLYTPCQPQVVALYNTYEEITMRDTLVNIFFAWLIGLVVLSVIVLVGTGVTVLLVNTFGTSVATAVGVFLAASVVVAAAFYQLLFDGGF